MAAGEAILFAEGYGFCRAMEDVENATWRFWARREYIEAEQARLAEIEGTRLSDQDAGLEAEAAAIDARAYARAGTPELRAKVGILVAIDPEGTLAVERRGPAGRRRPAAPTRPRLRRLWPRHRPSRE